LAATFPSFAEQSKNCHHAHSMGNLEGSERYGFLTTILQCHLSSWEKSKTKSRSDRSKEFAKIIG
jgi:hypothetical protein